MDTHCYALGFTSTAAASNSRKQMTHTPPVRDPLSPLFTLHNSYPCPPMLRKRHNSSHAIDQRFGLHRSAARRPTLPPAATAASRPHDQPSPPAAPFTIDGL